MIVGVSISVHGVIQVDHIKSRKPVLYSDFCNVTIELLCDLDAFG